MFRILLSYQISEQRSLFTQAECRKSCVNVEWGSGVVACWNQRMKDERSVCCFLFYFQYFYTIQIRNRNKKDKKKIKKIKLKCQFVKTLHNKHFDEEKRENELLNETFTSEIHSDWTTEFQTENINHNNNNNPQGFCHAALLKVCCDPEGRNNSNC